MCTLEIAYPPIIIYLWCLDAYHIRLAEKNMVTHVEVSLLITPVEKFSIFCQYSTNANETIKSAQRLESMARQENFKVKKYHSDNGIFATTAFKTHCESQQQEFSFSSVGAHHQNGVAKRNIKTVAQ
jgi:hypothetical protein